MTCNLIFAAFLRLLLFSKSADTFFSCGGAGSAVLHVIDVLILLIFMFEAVIKILAQYPKPVSVLRDPYLLT